MEKKLVLSHIYIYPIKSLGGISLDAHSFEGRGLRYDRRWMLVDDKGIFLTQRKFAQMALLDVSLGQTHLEVKHRTENFLPLSIPLDMPGAAPAIDVVVWDDTVKAAYVSTEADAWFSRVLDIPCRLVYMTETSVRKVDTNYARNGEEVSFSDGYPFLLIGQASLDDLNSRLDEVVPMNRFRPNFVFTGGTAYEEEGWTQFRIGNHLFSGVKPCGRCVVTTIDQQTAEKGKEPLKTLAAYRTKNGKVLFGQNVLTHEKYGIVKVGDRVTVVK